MADKNKNKYMEFLKKEKARKIGKVIEKKEGEDNDLKTEPVKKKVKTTPKKTKKKKK